MCRKLSWKRPLHCRWFCTRRKPDLVKPTQPETTRRASSHSVKTAHKLLRRALDRQRKSQDTFYGLVESETDFSPWSQSRIRRYTLTSDKGERLPRGSRQQDDEPSGVIEASKHDFDDTGVGQGTLSELQQVSRLLLHSQYIISRCKYTQASAFSKSRLFVVENTLGSTLLSSYKLERDSQPANPGRLAATLELCRAGLRSRILGRPLFWGVVLYRLSSRRPPHSALSFFRQVTPITSRAHYTNEWQAKLSLRGVAQMPWDPKPVAPPLQQSPSASSALPSAATNGLPQSYGYNGQEPRIKAEPGTEQQYGSVPPGYQQQQQQPQQQQQQQQQQQIPPQGGMARAQQLAQEYQMRGNQGLALPGQRPQGLHLPQQAQQNSQQGPPQYSPQQQQFMRQQQAALQQQQAQPRIKLENDSPQLQQGGIPQQQQQQQQQQGSNPAYAQTDGADDALEDWQEMLAQRRAAHAANGERADRMMRDQAMQASSDLQSGLMVPLDEQPGRSLQKKHRTVPSHQSQTAHNGTPIVPQLDGDVDDDAKANVKDEDDENAINSDLDDSDEDPINAADDDDEEHGDTILCTYDKVQRVKNKWKCTLKDGVMSVGGKEWVFHKGMGEKRSASPSGSGSCCTCYQRLIIRAALKTKEEDGRHLSSWRGTLTKSSNVEIAALECDSNQCQSGNRLTTGIIPTSSLQPLDMKAKSSRFSEDTISHFDRAYVISFRGGRPDLSPSRPYIQSIIMTTNCGLLLRAMTREQSCRVLCLVVHTREGCAGSRWYSPSVGGGVAKPRASHTCSRSPRFAAPFNPFCNEKLVLRLSYVSIHRSSLLSSSLYFVGNKYATIARNQEKKAVGRHYAPTTAPLAAMKQSGIWGSSGSESAEISLIWTPYIYSASVPPEPGYPLTLPIQRGREAGVYLSFIVDHYPNFPAYTVFLHASDHHWHNDESQGHWTNVTLANLRLDTVEREGYVNLRCNHNPGCPVSINPLSPTQTDIETGDSRSFFAEMYQEVLNVTTREQVPEHLGAACCSQFAVTRARILARPWEDYVRMREWALRGSDYADGRMNSYGVGWVFESLWHVIFGKEAVFCPEEGRCRCDLYGVKGRAERYTNPRDIDNGKEVDERWRTDGFGYTLPFAGGYPICNRPVKNRASFGLPYSIINILSSMGIRPSWVPLINNNLQLGISTIFFSTREKSFWAWARKSSSEARARRSAQDFAHVEAPVLRHPVEDAGPEAVGRGVVFAVGGTVGCARDVDDDGGPAAGEEFVRADGVVRSVAVEAAHEDDGRGGVGFGGAVRDADVEWDLLALVVGGCGGVGDADVLDGCLEEGGGSHVHVLLSLVGCLFDVGVDMSMASCFLPALASSSPSLLSRSAVGRNSFVYSTLYPSWMPFWMRVSKMGAKSSYLPSWKGYKLRSHGNFHFLFQRLSMEPR
ncbi:hypothetical protein KC361_g46 [Hortaea werneckii]|nr:hypothetical protein KC361_g46 [Hortaea werneckii]